VYYEIVDFIRLDEALRARLLDAEKERATSGAVRFWIESKEWYERIETGDRLIVRYQWLGGDDIEVIGIENPKHKASE
jgi:hypothetical protein